jgi:hypothetical protein
LTSSIREPSPEAIATTTRAKSGNVALTGRPPTPVCRYDALADKAIRDWTSQMGAWGTGVFDNDGAGDFLTLLEDAEPSEREAVIREAFEAITDPDADDYLEVDAGQEAIAAAAVIAAAHNNRPVTDQDSVVTFAAADLPPATPELRTLAVEALNRVTGPESEWRELWEETDDFDTALAAVNEVRSALA